MNTTTTVSTATPSPLIADGDAQFILSLKRDPAAHAARPILATSADGAKEVIADLGQPLSGIFLSAALENPLSIPVLSFAIQHRPGTPVFLLRDQQPLPISSLELRKLTVRQALQKPVTLTQILAAITACKTEFEPELAVALADSSKVDDKATLADADLVPIRAQLFVSGSASYFDVYVRVQPDHYVKVLRAGDDFTPDRLDSYMRRGVTYFYIRRKAQEHYVRFCGQIASNLLRRPDVSVEVKASFTVNHGEETERLLREQGISDSSIEHGKRFAENAFTLAQALPRDPDGYLKRLFDSIAHAEHGTGVATLATMIGHELKFETGKSVHIVGLAAFLHDVGLQASELERFHDFRGPSSTPLTLLDEQILFRHPTLGAEILARVKGVDPAVLQAVSQHHERRDRSGYPRRLGAGGTNRVAEVIGLAEDFTHCLHHFEKMGAHTPLEAFEADASRRFSTPVLEAFRQLFRASPRAKAARSHRP